MVVRVCTSLVVSERRACRVLGQARTTQRHSPHTKDDEERLVARIIELPNTIWQVWVSKDNCTAEPGRLESESQESRENMEKRGSEGTQETAKERAPLAQ